MSDTTPTLTESSPISVDHSVEGSEPSINIPLVSHQRTPLPPVYDGVKNPQQYLNEAESVVADIVAVASVPESGASGRKKTPKTPRLLKGDKVNDILELENKYKGGILVTPEDVQTRKRKLNRMTIPEIDEYLEKLHREGAPACTLQPNVPKKEKKEKEKTVVVPIDSPEFKTLLESGIGQPLTAQIKKSKTVNDEMTDNTGGSDDDDIEPPTMSDMIPESVTLPNGQIVSGREATIHGFIQLTNRIAIACETLASIKTDLLDGYGKAIELADPQLALPFSVLLDQPGNPLEKIAVMNPLSYIGFIMITTAVAVAGENYKQRTAKPASREPAYQA